MSLVDSVAQVVNAVPTLDLQVCGVRLGDQGWDGRKGKAPGEGDADGGSPRVDQDMVVHRDATIAGRDVTINDNRTIYGGHAGVDVHIGGQSARWR